MQTARGLKTVTDLTQTVQSGIGSQQCSPTPTTRAGWMDSSTRDRMISEQVNRVFTRLEAIFPRTWRTAFTDGNMVKLAKREVAISMAKWSTLPTTHSLDMALERIKEEGGEWPPSIAKLVKILQPKPEDFGMPEVSSAFQEALQHAQNPAGHHWSHAAVRVAGAATGWFDMANATKERETNIVKSRFSKQYQAIVNRVMSGGAVEAQNLLETDRRTTPAQLAERAGVEQASAVAEKEYGRSMTGEQGMAALRNALKGGAA